MGGGAPRSVPPWRLGEAIARVLPTATAVHALGAEDDVSAGASLNPTDISEPTRARRFHRGRTCALRALTELGSAATVVGRGPRREPQWPVGFVGSITHVAELSAAAAGSTTHLRTIGIDAEPNDPLPAGVAELVVTDESELESCRSASPLVHWPTVLFSTKESIYKAWYPTFESWLDFGDVKVELSPTSPTAGTFRVEPSPTTTMAAAEARFVAELRGGYEVDLEAGLVTTSAYLPA